MKKICLTICFCLLLIITMNCGSLNVIRAKSKIINISVKGSYNYKLAQYILKYTNKERSKRRLPKLKMDNSLTRAAMKRVSELSICVSDIHKRPNGKDRASLNNKIRWENTLESYELKFVPKKASNKECKRIARGIVSSWMSSKHHRPGILMRSYKSIGIGVFYSYPWLYASQEFSWSKAKKVCKNKKVEKNKYHRVPTLKKYLAKKYFQVGSIAEGDFHPGDKESIWILHVNPYSKIIKVEVNPKHFRFTSSNKKVITVNKKGLLKAKKIGSSRIKVVFKGTSKVIWNMKISVQKAYEY